MSGQHTCPCHAYELLEGLHAGQQQERLALEAGFGQARHYQLAFGLMGCLVATKGS